MKAKIEIFTSPTCPHCPKAVKKAEELAKERDDIKILEISTATKNGQKKARELNVRSVPTLFITGPGYEDRIGHVGVPSRNALEKMIAIALGKEQWKEKKSLFSRIAEKINLR